MQESQAMSEAYGKADSKKRWINTMELAERLGVHPFSIPRLRKTKPGFPQPVKLFNKNLWAEDLVDQYIEKLTAAK
jgi:predicted DNA-binding transcriptional regulator AlpA